MQEMPVAADSIDKDQPARADDSKTHVWATPVKIGGRICVTGCKIGPHGVIPSYTRTLLEVDRSVVLWLQQAVETFREQNSL